MADLSANGLHVLACSISMPRTGVWTCDLELDGESALEGRITIKDGDLTFSGTVIRSGVVAGRVFVRAVGGAGGLRKTAPARSYVDVPLRIPLRDILADVGETLSLSVDAALLDRRLPHWTRIEGPAGTALSSLLDHVGASWRVLADGTVWAGAEVWPVQRVPGEALDPDPELGTHTLAADTFALRPGTTFLGRKVSRVEHRGDGAKLRTIYWAEDNAPAPSVADRAKESFARLVRWVMRDVRYHKLYPCVVQRQDAGGALDLYPDDEEIRGSGTSGVPIKHGLPGCTVRVKVGARVLMGFENGDPNRPYASLWEHDGLESISFDDGTQPLARLGDLVASGGPMTGCTITTTVPVPAPPGVIAPGTPIIGFISFEIGAPDPSGITAKPLYGAIASGAQKVLG
jgi:hypothetical protein